MWELAIHSYGHPIHGVNLRFPLMAHIGLKLMWVMCLFNGTDWPLFGQGASDVLGSHGPVVVAGYIWEPALHADGHAHGARCHVVACTEETQP
jgi:hypothetical protein